MFPTNSRPVDGREPPQDGHLELEDADVVSRPPEQHVHIGVLGVWDDLLQLPEPPQHHVLEGPRPPRRRRPAAFLLPPHCEQHGFPSHVAPEKHEAARSATNFCMVSCRSGCAVYDTARGHL